MAERLRRSESGNALSRGKGKYPICIFAVATAFDGACEAFGYCIEVRRILALPKKGVEVINPAKSPLFSATQRIRAAFRKRFSAKPALFAVQKGVSGVSIRATLYRRAKRGARIVQGGAYYSL